MIHSDEILIGVEIVIVVAVGVSDDVVELELVTKEASDTTESLDVLETIRGLVSDELDLDAVVFVMKAEPISKLFAALNLKVDA